LLTTLKTKEEQKLKEDYNALMEKHKELEKALKT